jgi:uncharacterized protein
MTRLTILAAATVLAALAASRASAAVIQPIDCNIDLATSAERTICKSQHLQILDAQITEVYADLMGNRHIASAAKTRVRESQYQFLQRRNACGGDRDCLEEVMQRRLSRIHNYI